MAVHCGRREFTTLLGGASAWPLAASAQQSGGMRRIGVLVASYAETDREGQARVAVFLDTFRRLLSRAAVLFGSDNAANVAFLRAAEAVAPSLGVQVTAVDIHADAQIERVIATFAGQPDGGLISFPHPNNTANRASIITLAARHRLPAIYPFRYFATEGGLMSYGTDQIDQWRGAATYVDRILRGEKPGDLPVQAPTKFELVINLKTAKAIGLHIPPAFPLRADEVIE